MRYRTLVAALLLALVSLGCAQALAEPEPEHPSHAARPTAGAPVPAAAGADHPGDVIGFMEGVQRAEWLEGVARGEAEAARLASDRSRVLVVGGGAGVGGDCAQLSAELGLSQDILWRESRCSWDAYNATGCGGRGCRGPAQIDEGHTADVSPWNPNVPGTCYGLDLSDPAQYGECIRRLPPSAWGY